MWGCIEPLLVAEEGWNSCIQGCSEFGGEGFDMGAGCCIQPETSSLGAEFCKTIGDDCKSIWGALCNGVARILCFVLG